MVAVWILIGLGIAVPVSWIVCDYRERRHKSEGPGYQSGDVVRNMYCNRCGRPLVLDLNRRIGEIKYDKYSGGKMRVLPNTGGECAWDSDVKGIAWCPECKDVAHMYSLVDGGGDLQMWGYIQRRGYTADYYDSLPVRVSHST